MFEEYFKKHPTQLWLFKHGIVFVAPGIVLFGLKALETYGADLWWVSTLAGILNMVYQKVSALDPNKYWEGFGKGKKKK